MHRPLWRFNPDVPQERKSWALTYHPGPPAGATCPFDLVKTRWQVQRGDMASQGKAWLGLNYKSPWHAVMCVTFQSTQKAMAVH